MRNENIFAFYLYWDVNLHLTQTCNMNLQTGKVLCHQSWRERWVTGHRLLGFHRCHRAAPLHALTQLSGRCSWDSSLALCLFKLSFILKLVTRLQDVLQRRTGGTLVPGSAVGLAVPNTTDIGHTGLSVIAEDQSQWSSSLMSPFSAGETWVLT